MPLDSLVLCALARELAGRLAGSRVQKIVQPDDKTVGLEVFPPSGAWLLMCIDARAGHLVLTEQRPASTPYPPPFAQLARSRIEGMHILGLEGSPADRVVTMTLSGGPPGERVRLRLVLELFGPAGDLFLVDDATGKILGHLRKGALGSRLAGGVYAQATAPVREDLMALDPAARRDRLERAIRSQGATELFRQVASVGPALCAVAQAALERSGGPPGEAAGSGAGLASVGTLPAAAEDSRPVDRQGGEVLQQVTHEDTVAAGRSEARRSQGPEARRVAEGLAQVLEAVAAGDLSPATLTIGRRAPSGPGGGEGRARPARGSGPGQAGSGTPEVILACPPALVDGLEVTRFASVNDAVRHGLVDVLTGRLLDERRRALTALLAAAREREQGRLAAAQKGLEEARAWPRLERWGNLLKGQIAAVAPFAAVAHVIDYYDPAAPTIDVPIKPTLAPRQNADRYFQRAKKLKASLGAIGRRIDDHTSAIALLARMEDELGAAVDRDAIEALEARARALTRAVGPGDAGGSHSRDRAARGAPAGTPSARAKAAAGVLTFVSSDGRSILVGRSARENDVLTKRLARPHDWWLHAQEAAGAHVVVRMRGPKDTCPESTLLEAAQLAAHYSKSRYDTRVTVLVARAGQVRKLSGAPEGQVTVRHHTTMTVRPDPAIVTRLMAPV